MEINSVAKSSKHLAAEFIASNEDIISEILLHLPVKSLIRFKLVSKDWRSLISEPHFAHRHTQISLKRNPDYLSPRGLFICHPGSQDLDCIPSTHSSETKNTNDFHFPSLSFLKSALNIRVNVVHSCNGLSLCRFTSRHGFDYCIANLTTQEFSRVPQPPDNRPKSSFSAFALVYNPLESPHCKIVGLREFNQTNEREESNHCSEILVYSSENGTWLSKWCFQSFGKFDHCKTQPAFWNGGLYWILNVVCYCLDLKTEDMKVKKIASPGNKEDYWREFTYHGWYALYLGEWCGHLHAVSIRQGNSDENSFQVLEFEEFSSEWFVKYTGNIASIIYGFPGATEQLTFGNERNHTFRILAMVRGDREEDSALVLAIPGKVISYRFMTQTVEVVHEKISFSYDIYSFSYIENLSPIVVGKGV